MTSNAPSSPVSSLSSLDSQAFPEEPKRLEDDTEHDILIHPSPKRRKVGSYPPFNYDSPTVDADRYIPDDISDVSSDTSGSVQGSPRAIKELGMPDEDVLAAEQVHTCGWDGCTMGELANLDELVHHLTEDHVNAAKTTKYTCQWSDCKAKGKTQMSAYALKAHLRSHTKEKPFYCALPECDRSFTRSDALAKHMRTVHENEAPRTLEHYSKHPHATLSEKADKDANTPMHGTPVPSAATASKPPQKLKLLLNPNKASASSSTSAAHHSNSVSLDSLPSAYTTPLTPESRTQVLGPLPADLGFTAHENSMSRHDLYRVLRRQLHWAEQSSTSLHHTIASLTRVHKSEFLAKELALENALEAAYAAAQRKGVVSAVMSHGITGSQPQGTLQEEKLDRLHRVGRYDDLDWRLDVGNRALDRVEMDVEAAEKLPLRWPKDAGIRKRFPEREEEKLKPWYRDAKWKESESAKRHHDRKKEDPHRWDDGMSEKDEGEDEDDDVVDDAALLGDADEADDDLELPDEDPAEDEGGNGDAAEHKRRQKMHGRSAAEESERLVEEGREDGMDVDETASAIAVAKA